MQGEKKNLFQHSYRLSLSARIKWLQSVYIFFPTQSWAAVHRLSKYRHKDLMEYIDLAHAAWGFVRFSTQLPKLLSSLQGEMAVLIHFERDIFPLGPGRHDFPSCRRMELTLVGIRLRISATCLTHHLYSQGLIWPDEKHILNRPTIRLGGQSECGEEPDGRQEGKLNMIF